MNIIIKLNNILSNFNKISSILKLLESLIQYLNIYKNYKDFVYNKHINFIHNIQTDYEQKIYEKIITIFFNNKLTYRLKIISILYALIYDLENKSKIIYIYVHQNIDEDNLQTIKNYVLQNFEKKYNIKIIHIDDAHNLYHNSLFMIKFRNFVNKFNFKNLLLYYIQTNKTNLYWKNID